MEIVMLEVDLKVEELREDINGDVCAQVYLTCADDIVWDFLYEGLEDLFDNMTELGIRRKEGYEYYDATS
jgi:hypothetical protein